MLSERLAWPSHLVKHDTIKKGNKHTDTERTPSWKATPSLTTCQGKDNQLCEGSLRRHKDYSPPISIKRTGNTLQSHVWWRWWWWWYSEFNTLWRILWLLIGRIHIILLLTLAMNDSPCDMFPEYSSSSSAVALHPQPLALADSLVICTSGIRGRRVSLRHNICYSLFQ